MKNLDYTKILRNVPCQEKLLNHAKRVQVFKGSQAWEALKNQGIEEEQIRGVMGRLLAEEVIVKAKLNNKDECEVSLSKKFSVEDTYIWVKDPPAYLSLLMSIAFVIFCLSLVMFQLWPRKLKVVASYAAYPILGFIVFLVVLSIFRLIFFCITFFSHSPGIWIFPNLFADVGFFESFVPLWEYHGVDTKPTTKEE